MPSSSKRTSTLRPSGSIAMMRAAYHWPLPDQIASISLPTAQSNGFTWLAGRMSLIPSSYCTATDSSLPMLCTRPANQKGPPCHWARMRSPS
jgi:hypothetical protein